MSYEDVTGYVDYDAGTELATSVRDRLEGDGHDDPKLLRVELERMKQFQEAADRTVDSCQQQINQLKWQRMALHGQEAADRFDGAIAQLDRISDRANRLIGLLVDTIKVAEDALDRWETRQRRFRTRK